MCKNLDRRLSVHMTKNILLLFVQHGTNYAGPILINLYLIRLLSVSEYGVFALLSGIAAFFSILIDYGFHLSFVRKIAAATDPEVRSEVFVLSIILKIVFAITFLAPYLLIVTSLEMLSNHRSIALAFYLISVGTGAMPTWAYQGLQNLKFPTYLNTVVRSIGLLSVFILVKTPNDLLVYPLVNGGLLMIATVAMYAHLKRIYGFGLRRSYSRKIRSYLFEATPIFFASLSTSVYTIFVTFSLGLFSSASQVAIYSSCEKVVTALRALALPFIQATYPEIAKLLSDAENPRFTKVQEVIVRYYLPLLIFLLTTCVLLSIHAESVMKNLFGAEYIVGSGTLRIMVFVAPVIVLGNIAGVQLLLNLGGDTAFRNIIMASALTMLIAIMSINYDLTAKVAACLLVLVEVLITLAFMYYALQKVKFIKQRSNR